MNRKALMAAAAVGGLLWSAAAAGEKPASARRGEPVEDSGQSVRSEAGETLVSGSPADLSARLQQGAGEACCLGDGTCVDGPVRDCSMLRGDPQGPDTTCAGMPERCVAQKWCQPPVPAPASNIYYGWDQHSVWDQPQEGPSTIVADDWVCTTSEPVGDIHWWGSYVGWKQTNPPATDPPVDHFHVLIWTDVPRNPGDPLSFSHPGQVIWEVVRPRIDTNETFVGWDFRPATRDFEATFHYDLDLDLPEWFYQDPTPGQNVYWVTVAACYEPNPILPLAYPWGWKTRPRDPSSPAPDAAVKIFDPWGPGLGSLFVNGEPICWPAPGNPPCGPADQWDMAFELTTKHPVDVFKWSQRPDTSTEPTFPPTGMDVDASAPFMLADDFLCTVPSDISQITIFGSWDQDILPIAGPGDVIFTLGFHTDIPANINPDGPWSAPGSLLWSRTFNPGEFVFGSCGTQLQEGWFQPPAEYHPVSDTMCFTYTFNLNPMEFRQRGTAQAPVIHWLSVQVVPGLGAERTAWGWKTSIDRWNDDGTWDDVSQVPPEPWRELRYPLGHPYEGQSINLAFELVGTIYEPAPKWTQPPEVYDGCFRGWDELSWYGGAQIVADDWPCETNRPITDIHWWGSYKGWMETVPPPVGPDRFHIGIWTDVPAGPAFSHPRQMVAEFVVPRTALTERAVGCDTIDSSLGPDTCFRYDFDPDAILFSQPDATCSIYWVSIAAMYPLVCACNGDLNGDGQTNAMDLAILAACFGQPPVGMCVPADINCDGVIDPRDADALQCLMAGGQACCPGTMPEPPGYPWGWKTREHMFMDDAVRILSPTAPVLDSFFDVGEPIIGFDGLSWDMAFVLTSGEAPEACCLVQTGDPVCQDLRPSRCLTMGGVPQGAGTVCNPVPEACCLPDGTCKMVDPLCCDEIGGIAQGPASQCTQLQACCLSDGTCRMVDPLCCDELGGIAQGAGTQCTAAEACCMSDGTCRMLDPLCCREQGGNPQGTGTQCTALEACCRPGGACVFLDPLCCDDMGGTPQGPGTSCNWPAPCCMPNGTCSSVDPLCCFETGGTTSPIGALSCMGDGNGNGVDDACETPLEACCLRDGTCVETTHAGCVGQGGDPQGPNTICDLRVCPGLKWAQPPTLNVQSPRFDCFWGWDEASWYSGTQIVADDWLCDDIKPITDIHWWGSYRGWNQPDPPPPAVAPRSFHIGLWTDVPFMPPGFSHPGTLIRQWIVPRDALRERMVGCDFHPDYPNTDSCFRYDFAIPEAEWFWQEPACNIFWVSISAMYDAPPAMLVWGWKTREHFFMDDAVRVLVPNAPLPGAVFQAGEPILDSGGVSWDMAFAITTKPCPRPSPPSPDLIPNTQGGMVVSAKNRALSFTAGDAGRNEAIRVTFVSVPAPFNIWNGRQFWVGDPKVGCETAGVGLGQACAGTTFPAAALQCGMTCRSDWSTMGTIHAYHEGIVPRGQYRVEVLDCSCDPGDPASYSPALSLTASMWGDVCGPFVGGLYTAPDGRVDITIDVTADLNKFGNRPGAPIKARADVEPSCLDWKINITDVTRILDAFRGLPYPFVPLNPDPCLSPCR